MYIEICLTEDAYVQVFQRDTKYSRSRKVHFEKIIIFDSISKNRKRKIVEIIISTSLYDEMDILGLIRNFTVFKTLVNNIILYDAYVYTILQTICFH